MSKQVFQMFSIGLLLITRQRTSLLAVKRAVCAKGRVRHSRRLPSEKLKRASEHLLQRWNTQLKMSPISSCLYRARRIELV